MDLKNEMKSLGACGLNCQLCPYYLLKDAEARCPGCWKIEKCFIRDCAKARRIDLCLDCTLHPCSNFHWGFHSMINRLLL